MKLLPPSPFSLFFVYSQLLWHFDGRLGLVKSVLLFKGGLTSLWLMRLLWLMCTSLTGTVSQRCVDAELLPNFIAPEELSHTEEVRLLRM